jgi:small subunit ribosomal protein S17
MISEDRGNRKSKRGRVVSNKMNKTVVVAVESTIRHPRYEKVIRRRQKLYAHHEGEPLSIGDEVTVVETRPLSKLKRWRVVETAETSKA